MVQKRGQVSYIIPSPSESIPRLQLPPHGISRLSATGPLLTTFAGQSGTHSFRALTPQCDGRGR